MLRTILLFFLVYPLSLVFGQNAWHQEAENEVYYVKELLGLSSYYFADIYWSSFSDYRYAINDSVTLFVFPLLTGVMNPCDTNEMMYCDCQLHYAFFDSKSNHILFHAIDSTIYTMDAIRIYRTSFDESTIKIGPDIEGIGLSIEYGHNLKYNPYWENRYIVFDIMNYSEVLDIQDYSISGEIGGFGFIDQPYYESYIRFNKLRFTWDTTVQSNNYYNIQVEDVKRQHDGPGNRQDLKTPEDYETLNDTTYYTLIYMDGRYRSK